MLPVAAKADGFEHSPVGRRDTLFPVTALPGSFARFAGVADVQLPNVLPSGVLVESVRLRWILQLFGLPLLIVRKTRKPAGLFHGPLK